MQIHQIYIRVYIHVFSLGESLGASRQSSHVFAAWFLLQMTVFMDVLAVTDSMKQLQGNTMKKISMDPFKC